MRIEILPSWSRDRRKNGRFVVWKQSTKYICQVYNNNIIIELYVSFTSFVSDRFDVKATWSISSFRRINQNSFAWITVSIEVVRPDQTLQRDSSVTRLVRLNIGRLNCLVRKLSVSEVRPDEQTETQQHNGKTEQGADQLARHSWRPGDGTYFKILFRNGL